VSPEVLVVVDNQNPNRHPHSLVRASFAFHGGNPTVVALVPVLSAIPSRHGSGCADGEPGDRAGDIPRVN
jgi:aspartate-semialdehyde dehydrogenase